jgi:hypothetical protein
VPSIDGAFTTGCEELLEELEEDVAVVCRVACCLTAASICFFTCCGSEPLRSKYVGSCSQGFGFGGGGGGE